MRILLSTTHASDNYGAVLQAACLASVLGEFGEVSVLDHRPPILNAGYVQDWLPYQVLRRRPNPEFVSFVRKHKAMRRAQRRLLPLTEPVRRRPRPTDYAGYDVAVVGSDEVWSDLWGTQDQFFLTAAPAGTRRVAYAVSAGRTRRWAAPERARAALGRFDHVLVRDGNTARLCEVAGRAADDVVADPVLLADPDHLRALGDPSAAPCRRYGLVYQESCRPDPAVDRALRDAGLHRRPVSVGFPYPDSDARISAGLPAFVSLVEHAHLVVTTMFHGVVTALALGRPVAIIDHPAKREKVADLLERVAADDVEQHEGYLLVRGASDIDELRRRSHKALAEALG